MPRSKFGDDPAQWRNRGEEMRTLAEQSRVAADQVRALP